MKEPISSEARPLDKNEYERVKRLYFNKLQVFNDPTGLGNILNRLTFNRLKKHYKIGYSAFIYFSAAYQLSEILPYNSFTISHVKSLLMTSQSAASSNNDKLLKLGYIEHTPNMLSKYRITDKARNMLKGYISHYNKEITRIADKYPEMFK